MAHLNAGRRRAAGGKMTAGAGMGDVELHQLLGKAVAGDAPAWRRVVDDVEPRLVEILRRPSFIARLSDDAEACGRIARETCSRLADDGFARLRAYLRARDEDPALPFFGWLIVVAKRVAIEHGRQPGSPPDEWPGQETLPRRSDDDGTAA
jgi:hypothetical protein